MKYKKFIIRNYRAIDDSLEIDITRKKLIPIIGANECGKTTILQGILCFDKYSDGINRGKHLQEIQNLYKPFDSKSCEIEAVIDISEDIESIFSKSDKDIIKKVYSKIVNKNLRKSIEETEISIIRKLGEKKSYYTSCRALENVEAEEQNLILETLIKDYLPPILYFDDFNNSMPNVIPISTNESKNKSWAQVMDVLFHETRDNFSIASFLRMINKKQQESALNTVTERLKATLVNEWEKIRVSDEKIDTLTIQLKYEPNQNTEEDSESNENEINGNLKISLLEKQEDGEPRVFDLKDRSKDFYWFFNFVMQLEFNPKKLVNNKIQKDLVFLLDEPGSYLHLEAQAKLCQKLAKIGETSNVIYCTHSHPLLNPNHIDLSNIKIAYREADKSIKLSTIFEYHKGNTIAFEPIYHAIGFPHTFLDEFSAKYIIFMEGIVDFYTFRILANEKQKKDYIVIPCTGSSSKPYSWLPLLISRNKSCICIYDDDRSGRNLKKKFIEVLHTDRAKCYLMSQLCDVNEPENLFDSKEISYVRERLQLNTPDKKKIIAGLFYYQEKNEIIDKKLKKSKMNFNKFMKEVDKKFKKTSSTKKIKKNQ